MSKLDAFAPTRIRQTASYGQRQLDSAFLQPRDRMSQNRFEYLQRLRNPRGSARMTHVGRVPFGAVRRQPVEVPPYKSAKKQLAAHGTTGAAAV